MKSYGYEQNQNTCLTKQPSGNIHECHEYGRTIQKKGRGSRGYDTKC